MRGYTDVNWFLRSVRVLPVIAGAALLGGMIGGFAIYAIDSALTWDPVPRPEARADNQTNSQTSAADQQATKPARIVGGAIPDPSAGMSAPPPAPPQQRAAVPAQSQLSSQLLTPKPLGPASQLQPQTGGTTRTPSAPPTPNQQNQTANQGTIQPPVQTQSAAGQQPTRWPDALSRAHQDAVNAQQQTAPATTQASPPAASQPSTDRAATAVNTDDQDRSRRDRRSRRHTIAGTNGSRNGGEDNAFAAPSPRQQDARSYGRLYDSYGSRRQQSYGNAREQPDAREDQSYGSRRQQSYGNPREQTFRNSREDWDNGSRSATSRSDTRQYGRDDARSRSRVIVREQPDETNRGQGFEARRSEPFWGGGFFRRGGDYRDDD